MEERLHCCNGDGIRESFGDSAGEKAVVTGILKSFVSGGGKLSMRGRESDDRRRGVDSVISIPPVVDFVFARVRFDVLGAGDFDR